MPEGLDTLAKNTNAVAEGELAYKRHLTNKPRLKVTYGRKQHCDRCNHYPSLLREKNPSPPDHDDITDVRLGGNVSL